MSGSTEVKNLGDGKNILLNTTIISHGEKNS